MRGEKVSMQRFENDQNELNFILKHSYSEILDRGYSEGSGYHVDRKADQG
jgi:hypothetical protein